jgi:uncharacterized protein (TIGR00725 family)
MRRNVVGVVGAGEASEKDRRNAQELGILIARNRWVVLSGGRNAGVMDAVSRGAKSVPGSLTVGILPTSGTKVSRYVDLAIFTDMHNARNNLNVLSSDVVVACGVSGAGTVSEVALALKAKKPVILLGADKLGEEFFKKLGRNQVLLARTPQDVIKLIKQHKLCPRVFST